MMFTLMAYFLSLGHSFIPHHNHNNHSEHYHHDHSIEPEGDHRHIEHGCHLDHGLLDYIACVLGDHHHSDIPCKVYEEVLTQKQNNNQNDLSVLAEHRLVLSKVETSFHYPCYHIPFYDNRFLANVIARRGPPYA